MALVEITRFAELHEGHIAAGALKASGIEAWFPGHGWGAVDWTMRQATGGFPLYVDEAKVAEALVLLGETRKPDPEALAWTKHPKALTGLPLAALSAVYPLFGMSVAVYRKAGSGAMRLAAVVVAALLLAILLLLLIMAAEAIPDIRA